MTPPLPPLLVSTATASTTRRITPLFFLLLALLYSTAAASSYSAVTALDKYGNSVQLQHAREAASRHGTPMIAAMATDGIVVVSVLATNKNKAARSGIIRSEESQLIHPLSWHKKNNKNQKTMAIVCTGIKADAHWLIQTLREYQKRQWETYDLTTLSSHKCHDAMTQILLLFMGYNRNRELQDISVVVDDDNSASWSRPMGVQSLLLSCSSTSSSSSIALVDPSGVVVPDLTAQAIGRNSDAIHTKLEESPYDPKTMSVVTVQELLVSIAQDVFELSESDELVVELLTKDGIQRQQRRRVGGAVDQ